MNRVLLLSLAILAVTTAARSKDTQDVTTDPCRDKVDCRTYPANTCTKFQGWAQENCKAFCHFCNPTHTTPAPKCEDKLPDCTTYTTDVCSKYKTWAEDNCREFCGFCSKTSYTGFYGQCNYKGKAYSQGQTWEDGCDYVCSCVDGDTGRYTCNNKCPVYTNLPSACTLVKSPGQCCLQPVCNFNQNVNIFRNSGRGQTAQGTNVCVYKGKQYFQGQTWADGCEYRCTCLDANAGSYQCQSFCPQYSGLPSECVLSKKNPGDCCQTAKCTFNQKMTGSFSGGGSVSGGGIGKQYTTSGPCVDKLPNCPSFTKDACGKYPGWAKGNCKKFCDLCHEKPPTPGPNDFCFHNGQQYRQGQTWKLGCDTECVCENSIYGYYRCNNLCPTYSNLPSSCTTEKKAGECCASVKCTGSGTYFSSSGNLNSLGSGGGIRLNGLYATMSTGATFSPGIGGTGMQASKLAGCLYNGNIYALNQQWFDQCAKVCVCLDADKGMYSCRARCPQYNGVPAGCQRIPNPTDSCCTVPSCSGYIAIPIFQQGKTVTSPVKPPSFSELFKGVTFSGHFTQQFTGGKNALPPTPTANAKPGGIGYCQYNGRHYLHGERWEDGCQYNCICLDGFSGYYKCSSRCKTFQGVPNANCILIPDTQDACCQVPLCKWDPKWGVIVGSGVPPTYTTPRVTLKPTDTAPITTPAPKFCDYHGTKYSTGQVWYDGCSLKCICDNADIGFYRCSSRCPEFYNVPKGCTNRPDPRDPLCCTYPDCSFQYNTTSIFGTGQPQTLPPVQVVVTPSQTSTHIGFCEYHGTKYTQGQKWVDGCQYNCECVDANSGKYRCVEICPRYAGLPPQCRLVTNFRQPCCQVPECNFGSKVNSVTGIGHMTPSPGTNLPTCVYQGAKYYQGQTWRDGCSLSCRCENAVQGLYVCDDRCPKWGSLPANCHLETNPMDPCCRKPTCHFTGNVNTIIGHGNLLPTLKPGVIVGQVPTPKPGQTPTPVSTCTYKGVQYRKGQTWQDGCSYNCECLDDQTGKYKCTERCPTYAGLPAECTLMKSPSDPCCQEPRCDFGVVTLQVTGQGHTTPSPPLQGMCIYKGKTYATGQQWNDGCEYTCECDDGARGIYRCTKRCATYGSLPKGCFMVTDPKDPFCCKAPACNFPTFTNGTTGHAIPTIAPGIKTGGNVVPTPNGHTPSPQPGVSPKPLPIGVCFYKGMTYHQGQRWQDGCDYNCECVDAKQGKYKCTQMCPVYAQLPRQCTMVPDIYNPCCKLPRCDFTVVTAGVTGTGIPVTPSPVPNAFCVYNGAKFRQGATWNDGCDLLCVCEDAKAGIYRCNERCATYQSSCPMIVDSRDKCCKVPNCAPVLQPTLGPGVSPGLNPTPFPYPIPTAVPGKTHGQTVDKPNNNNHTKIDRCMYQNKLYRTKDTWTDGCRFTCVCDDETTGRYTCTEKCLPYTNVPSYCTMIVDPQDSCCKVPKCLPPQRAHTTQAPPTGITPTKGGLVTPQPKPTCVYKNTYYIEGQVWYDGCDKRCVCEDGKTNYYRCTSRCAVFHNVPTQCRMVADPKDPQCCRVPDCIPTPGPSGYPTPAVVTNVPGIVTGIAPTPTPGTQRKPVCIYKGLEYHQGERWQDGCKYNCICEDQVTGKYKCEERCNSYPFIPPQCKLKRDYKDICCFELSCDYSTPTPGPSPSPGVSTLSPTQAPTRVPSPHYCVYKGVVFQQGQTWTEGCSKKCRCDDASTNFYNCFDRCPTYGILPPGCTMVINPKDSCCKVPQCYVTPTLGPGVSPNPQATPQPSPLPTGIPGTIIVSPNKNPLTNVGYCMFKGHKYTQGNRWNDGCDMNCVCLDNHSGQYKCTERCPNYVNIPSYCILVQDPKDACCQTPICPGVKPQPLTASPGPSGHPTTHKPQLTDVCVYNGRSYTQGQQWYEGCDKKCVCEDGVTGFYRCSDRCAKFAVIAPNCIMVPDVKDPKCCSAPQCDQTNKTVPTGVYGHIVGHGLPPTLSPNVSPLPGTTVSPPLKNVCMYKGVGYQQGRRWQDGCDFVCVCEDGVTGKYTCTDKCPRYPNLPYYCSMVYDPTNPCCQKPECLIPSPSPGPNVSPPVGVTKSPVPDFCVYNGLPYRQGQSWELGCDKICRCEDASVNEINCDQRCKSYPQVPSDCTLITDPTDKCCQVPNCGNTNTNSHTIKGVKGTIFGQMLPPNNQNPLPKKGVCVYHGKTYHQGETWRDGCTYNCECIDAMDGKYKCTEVCARYPKVPSFCTMMQDPQERCCEVPYCPTVEPPKNTLYPTPYPIGYTPYPGATPYPGPSPYPIGFTPSPGATPYPGPTPWPIGYTPYPGATPYPGPTPYPIGFTPSPGATPYLGPTPYPLGFTPYPGATPYPGPSRFPIGFTPSPGATPYLGPTPWPIGFTPFPGATPYPGPSRYPIGFTPSPGATRYLGPTPYPIGFTPYPGATPYPGPSKWPIGFTPSPGATPYLGPTPWPIGYTPSPGATPYMGPKIPTPYPIGFTPSPGATPYLGPTPYPIGYTPWPGATPYPGPSRWPIGFTPFPGATRYLGPTPYPIGYTPWPGATPYPGPSKYPIGFTPSPGATPYLGPTPYPIGYIPFPGATPYPGPTRYPIGFTPSPGATPYLGPTPWPIGYIPFPGATPYPGPTRYPIGFTPSPGATPYRGPTPWPIGYTPWIGATPYPGPTPYPIGFTPSPGATPYHLPTPWPIGFTPYPGATPYPGPTKYPIGFTPSKGATPYHVPTPWPIGYTPWPGATPYPGPSKYPFGYTPSPGATPYLGPTPYPLGFTPYPGATPYPGPTRYPIGFTPSPGATPYLGPTPYPLGFTPFPGATPYPGPTRYPIGFTPFPGATRYLGPTPWPIGFTPFPGATPYPGPSKWPIGFTPSPGATPYPGPTPYPVGYTPSPGATPYKLPTIPSTDTPTTPYPIGHTLYPGGTPYPGPTPYPIGFTPYPGATPYHVPTPWPIGFTPYPGATPYPGPTKYPIGFTPSPGATRYLGPTPWSIGFTPYPGATPYPGPSKYPIGFTPSPGATRYLGPTPYPIGYTPYPGATPYPGPSKWPVGFTPSPGATPYPGPTPWPIGYTPYPGATPYPGPTPYPIGFTPSPGATPYKAPTPWPIGYTPYPGATPYPGPTPYPIGFTPSPGATPYKLPTPWPIGFTPYPGATPYPGPTPYPAGFTPSPGATPYYPPTPWPIGFTPFPGATPYPGPTKYPIGFTPSPGATPYVGPTPWPIGYTPYPGATPYPGPTPYPIGYTPSPGATPYLGPTPYPIGYTPFIGATPYPGPSRWPIGFTPSPGATPYPGPTPYPIGYTPWPGATPYPGPTPFPQGFTPSPGATPYYGPTPYPIGFVPFPGATPYPGPSKYPIGFTPSPGATPYLGPTPWPIGFIPYPGATPYPGPSKYPLYYTPSPGATPYLGPTPYPIGYTPWLGATPYPGPSKYPIGFTPFIGATRYLGPTPYPIGYTPFPGATPYPGPNKYPIGFTPYVGATRYLGPTPWPIGYTPFKGATPYPGPSKYPIGFVPYPGATRYLGPTPWPIGYTPSIGATPYPGPSKYPIGFTPSPGATPYLGPTPWSIGFVPYPGGTPYPGPTRYPLGYTPSPGATPYAGPTPWPIGYTPSIGATPYPGRTLPVDFTYRIYTGAGHSTPAVGVLHVCVYNGQYFKQGQVWYDGCNKVCRCESADTNYYRCQDRCVRYDNVSPDCLLVPSSSDPSCCLEPKCPVPTPAPGLTPKPSFIINPVAGYITGYGHPPTVSPGVISPSMKGCMYKGNLHPKGAKWADGCDYDCECLDDMTGQYKCTKKCPVIPQLPPQCVLLRDPANLCCNRPYCDFTNPTPFPGGIPTTLLPITPSLGPHVSTNSPNVNPTVSVGFCMYKGVTYKKGQTWNDGCVKTCICDDPAHNLYTCNDMCKSFARLPFPCTLETDPNNRCCLVPNCNHLPSQVVSPVTPGSVTGSHTVYPGSTQFPVVTGTVSYIQPTSVPGYFIGTSGTGTGIPGKTGSIISGYRNMCVYKGSAYPQGQTWEDGCNYRCECIDAQRGRFKCTERCGKYYFLPPQCQMVPSVTDRCCKEARCYVGATPTPKVTVSPPIKTGVSSTTSTSTPSTTAVTAKPTNMCVYLDGKTYSVGQHWQDGCAFNCVCKDPSTNSYECTMRCLSYSGLPSYCSLIKDPADQCCMKPKCSINGKPLTPLLGNLITPTTSPTLNPSVIDVIPIGVHQVFTGQNVPLGQHYIGRYGGNNGCYYKHTMHPQGTSWDDACKYACTCEINMGGRYKCVSKCPQYPPIPSYCHYVSVPGQCCPSLSCNVPGTGKPYNPVPQINPTPRPTGVTPTPGVGGQYIVGPVTTTNTGGQYPGGGVTVPPGMTLLTSGQLNKCIYNNRMYNQGEKWNDGCKYSCECLDSRTGYYRCIPRCADYSHIQLPSQCYLVTSPGGCCSTPVCRMPGGSTVDPIKTPGIYPVYGSVSSGFTGFRPGYQLSGYYNQQGGRTSGCVYKGVLYRQGQTWTDGCDYSCTCQDQNSGQYRCTQMCQTYTRLPSVCRMVPVQGQCCKQVSCQVTTPTPTPRILTGSPGPCVDKLDNCDGFGHSSCGGIYAGWAHQNCPAFCGFCTPDITTTPVPCKDTIKNCDQYTHSACDGTFRPWALAHCRQFCGLCSTTTYSRPVTVTTMTPSVTCQDKIKNCQSYGSSVCTQFRTWAFDNCKQYCNFCNTTKTVIPSGWTILMKGVSGVPGNLYSLWTGTGTLHAHVPAAMNLLSTYKGNFKPDISNHWDQCHFNKIRVAIYNNGVEKAYVVFNAQGATKTSWFDPSRIIDSSWGDIKTIPKNLFQMMPDPFTGSQFFMGSSGSGCDTSGWMMIATNNFCQYAKGHPVPAFYYAPGGYLANWKTTQPASGDVFAILGQGNCDSTHIGTTSKPITGMSRGCYYKGKTYKESAHWIDGCDYNCTCVDGSTGQYRCIGLCPIYQQLSAGCTLVKTPGECCSKPVCNTQKFCYFNGQHYEQNQTWTDGCKQRCTCEDASSGRYLCRALCLKWTLPPVCTFDPPKPGKCCSKPNCPSNVHLTYPPDYIDA